MDVNNDAMIEPFSARELEILQLVSDGLTNREIAERLYLAIDTVKWYNKQIFIKLEVSNRTQASKKAAELKLLESERISLAQENERAVSNLPAQVSSYVGRVREIGEIKELLKEKRLVTLTGAGGSGKTRLALRVAEELQGSYPDGIWLVELANILDASLVIPTIANVWNITSKTEESLDEVLKRSVRHKHLLLVIDNLEHLLDSAPLISDLLAAAPQLSVLATSRERLHISGEQEYPVQPLSLPDPYGRWTSEELKDTESVILFIKRARAVNPNLSLDEGSLQHLARICLCLDGLPLAIELCAPMVKVFPLGVIAERIESNLDSIPQGPRDLPTRQQTLNKTIQWSYNLLKDNEKRLFERMAVFNGGGTLAAIKYVCGENISGNIANLLSALVNKNLVLAQERQDGEIHFNLLETIRQHNQELLKRIGELESLSDLHAKYFVQLAKQAHDEFSSPKHKYWFLHLKVEQNNIRSAMKWVLQTDNPTLGLRLGAAIQFYWHYYGFTREALHWNELALENSDRATLADKAIAMLATGSLYIYTNDFERGRVMLRKVLKFFRELGDESNEAWTMIYIGPSYIGQKDKILSGIKVCKRGLDYFKKENDLGGMARALNHLGELCREKGDVASAKKYYHECLQLAQESGEMIREAIQLGNLGAIAYEEKEYLLAEKLVKQALVKFLELDGKLGMSLHFGSLVGPTLALGKPLRAARLLGASTSGLDSLEGNYQLADLSMIENYSRKTQAALDKEAFKKAFEEGQRMPILEAVAYALNEDGAG